MSNSRKIYYFVNNFNVCVCYNVLSVYFFNGFMVGVIMMFYFIDEKMRDLGEGEYYV